VSRKKCERVFECCDDGVPLREENLVRNTTTTLSTNFDQEPNRVFFYCNNARLEKVNPRVFVRDSEDMFYKFLILIFDFWFWFSSAYEFIVLKHIVIWGYLFESVLEIECILLVVISASNFNFNLVFFLISCITYLSLTTTNSPSSSSISGLSSIILSSPSWTHSKYLQLSSLYT